MAIKSTLTRKELEQRYKESLAAKQPDRPKAHFDTTPPSQTQLKWVEDMLAVAAPPDYDYGKAYELIKGKRIDCLYPNAVYFNHWAKRWCVHIQGQGFNLAFDGALQQDIVYFKTEADALYAAAFTFKNLFEQSDWMAFNNWCKPYLAPRVKAYITQRLTDDGFVLALDSSYTKGVSNKDGESV